MDPTLSEESLQKTSTGPDPAAFSHLCATMSAQASQLAAHQHQLNRLTSITEELVKALKSPRYHSPGDNNTCRSRHYTCGRNAISS